MGRRWQKGVSLVLKKNKTKQNISGKKAQEKDWGEGGFLGCLCSPLWDAGDERAGYKHALGWIPLKLRDRSISSSHNLSFPSSASKMNETHRVQVFLQALWHLHLLWDGRKGP